MAIDLAKQDRVEKANQLLSIIASCGRNFFKHGGQVSFFRLDQHGRVWFVDAYTGRPIYTHYTKGRWIGFSEGGTLRDVVIRLRDFITIGKQLGKTFGPFPDWYSDGDPWGYEEHMQWVRTHAQNLGIVQIAI